MPAIEKAIGMKAADMTMSSKCSNADGDAWAVSSRITRYRKRVCPNWLTSRQAGRQVGHRYCGRYGRYGRWANPGRGCQSGLCGLARTGLPGERAARHAARATATGLCNQRIGTTASARRYDDLWRLSSR